MISHLEQIASLSIQKSSYLNASFVQTNQTHLTDWLYNFYLNRIININLWNGGKILQIDVKLTMYRGWPGVAGEAPLTVLLFPQRSFEIAHPIHLHTLCSKPICCPSFVECSRLCLLTSASNKAFVQSGVHRSKPPSLPGQYTRDKRIIITSERLCLDMFRVFMADIHLYAG